MPRLLKGAVYRPPPPNITTRGAGTAGREAISQQLRHKKEFARGATDKPQAPKPLNPAIDKWGMDGSCQTAQGYVKLFDFEVAQMASRAQQVTDGRAT